MLNDENLSNNGWNEYGRLVLKELERLNHGQEVLNRELDDKFTELNNQLSKLSSVTTEVESIKNWKESVNNVWSTIQMQSAKNELYQQKNKWQTVIGIIIAVNVLFSAIVLVLTFKDIIFP